MRMENIEILIMTDNSLDTIGGAERSTSIILNNMRRYFSIGLIQPGNTKKTIVNIHYYPLTTETRIKQLIKKPFSFLRYIWEIRKVIRREKPKVIHTQAQVSFFIISLLRTLKLVPKKFTFIHTERGLYTKYNGMIRRIFRFFMKELDILVTTTEFNMKYWKRAIEKWNLSMDFQIIENTAGELFEIYDPKHERDADNMLVIGFAGRYATWKNWPLAIEISKKLNDKIGKKLKIYMAVGCLDDKSNRETQEMFNNLSNLLGDRFIGLKNIDLQKMDQFYYKLDFFILTSNYNTESFGRTLVEAMSRNTIVLTTDAGGSVEVVGNENNVYDKADDFVKRIIEIYYDKDNMEKEKKDNMHKVKVNYSVDNNVKKHIQMYKKLMEQ